MEQIPNLIHYYLTLCMVHLLFHTKLVYPMNNKVSQGQQSPALGDSSFNPSNAVGELLTTSYQPAAKSSFKQMLFRIGVQLHAILACTPPRSSSLLVMCHDVTAEGVIPVCVSGFATLSKPYWSLLFSVLCMFWSCSLELKKLKLFRYQAVCNLLQGTYR